MMGGGVDRSIALGSIPVCRSSPNTSRCFPLPLGSKPLTTIGWMPLMVGEVAGVEGVDDGVSETGLGARPKCNGTASEKSVSRPSETATAI